MSDDEDYEEEGCPYCGQTGEDYEVCVGCDGEHCSHCVGEHMVECYDCDGIDLTEFWFGDKDTLEWGKKEYLPGPKQKCVKCEGLYFEIHSCY